MLDLWPVLAKEAQKKTTRSFWVRFSLITLLSHFFLFEKLLHEKKSLEQLQPPCHHKGRQRQPGGRPREKVEEPHQSHNHLPPICSFLWWLGLYHLVLYSKHLVICSWNILVYRFTEFYCFSELLLVGARWDLRDQLDFSLFIIEESMADAEAEPPGDPGSPAS